MITEASFTKMSDSDLVSAAGRLAAAGREATADLIALLVVLEERKQVYADQGYSSVFRFCVGRLRLSEEEAYYRISAARVAARFPDVLESLRAGVLTITAVAVLRKHLTEENYARLLHEAEGRSKREVQQLVAALAPRPDVPPSIRRLPMPRASALVVRTADDHAGAAQHARPGPTASAQRAALAPDASTSANPSPPFLSLSDTPELGTSAGTALPGPERTPTEPHSTPPLSGPPPRPAEIRPLAPARYSLHVTISEETYGKLRQARDLLRHTLPDGDPAAVIDRALTLLVAHLQHVKFAARTARPPVPKRSAPPASARRPRHRPVASASASPMVGIVAEAELAPPRTSSSESVPHQKPPAPRPRSRHIPAVVKRGVWLRDQGCCAFVALNGQRCTTAGGRTGRSNLRVPVHPRGTRGNPEWRTENAVTPGVRG